MAFCNNILDTCDDCLGLIYGKCNDVITIKIGLTALTTFFIDLIDKFGNVTPLTITTDSNGDFTVTQIWTEFFGAIEILIWEESARVNPVSFTVGGTTFDCIVMEGKSTCNNRLDFSEICNAQYLMAV